MVVKFQEGFKFYIRFNKKVGNEYWKFASLFDEHTYPRTAHNRQAKTEWLAKKFGHILRHSPDMKSIGLIVELIDG